MPKSFSEQERAHIVRRLKAAAADCLGRYGVRRTTVDELVRRANIPKGTFYLFYSSKELLLFEVIVELHEEMERQVLSAVSAPGPGALTPDGLTELLLGFFKAARDMPLLRLMTGGELELLARKLPPEVVGEHFQQDSSMVELLFSVLPSRPPMDPETMGAALRAVFSAALQDEALGAGQAEGALRLLIRGLVLQLFEP